MSIDDDVLAEFEEGLDAIKGSPKAKAKTREDLIEQAQENFGSFFKFVPKLDASVKEKMGGNAGVTFDFGDYDEANSKLGAFLIISPAEAERRNLTIPVQFQGKGLGSITPPSGSLREAARLIPRPLIRQNVCSPQRSSVGLKK
jgi:hypothetical protein